MARPMTEQQYCTDLNPLCSPIGIFCAGCAAHSKQIGSRHYLASLVVSIPISSSSSALLYSRPYRMYVKSEEKCNEYGRTRSKKKKKSHKENAVHQCNFACVYWSVYGIRSKTNAHNLHHQIAVLMAVIIH